jgi:hypothetical protein
MQALDLLDALLAHEQAELFARLHHPLIVDADSRGAVDHKHRTIGLVRDWIADLQAARRPGAGGYSRGANHFHEHGELLPALDEGEVLAAMAIQRAAETVATGKFYAVG